MKPSLHIEFLFALRAHVGNSLMERFRRRITIDGLLHDLGYKSRNKCKELQPNLVVLCWPEEFGNWK